MGKRNDADFALKVRKLDAEDAANPFADFKMKSRVPSYDLLQNEKYSRLDDLKNALEGLSKNALEGLSRSRS